MGDRKGNRIKGFDYSQGYWYFITICVKNMITYLGRIRNGQMILNKYGQLTEERLKWLEEKYEYVKIDSFVVMPNHVHAILIIDGSNIGTSRDLSLHNKVKFLSQLVGAFKTTSSKYIHLAGLSEFKWQRSFYDRIIRNEQELFRIRKYIQKNPMNWDNDKSIPENIGLE